MDKNQLLDLELQLKRGGWSLNTQYEILERLKNIEQLWIDREEEIKEYYSLNEEE